MSQRQSPILAQLCTLLVDDQYGELASRVFETLARYGRQTLAAIVRNAKARTNLTGTKIKHGLVILIQQHLVFHNAETEHNLESYEVDWQQAYALARFGKMIKMTEHRFGEKAGALMSNLASFGHTRVGDIEDAYFPDRKTDKSNEALTNGHGTEKMVNGTKPLRQDNEEGVVILNGVAQQNGKKIVNGNPITNGTDGPTPITRTADQIDSPEELHAILYGLLEAGWLVAVDESHYLSPAERDAEAEAHIVGEQHSGRYPTSAAMIKELARETLRRKREVRDQALEIPKDKIKFHKPSSDRKRAAEDDGGPPSKRMKGANGVVNGAPDANNDMPREYGCIQFDFSENVTLDADLVVRVNHDKLTVALRSEQLIRLAEKRFCKTTSQVYQGLIWCLEKAEPRCYEEWVDPVDALAKKEDTDPTYHVEPQYLATANDVLKILHPKLDLLDGLEPQIAVTLLDQPVQVDKDGCTNPPIDPESLNRNERLRLINKHLACLAADRVVPFVTWQSNRGGGQYRIEYDLLTKTMIQREIDNTIMARLGKTGLCLIRALKKKGRLTEQEVCKTMLTTGNMIRSAVSDLQVAGFVQTQEVPRVESRITKQSDHLLWYDTQMAREQLLQGVYKGMVRHLQRIKYEKERVEPIIAKAERSDVVGHEEKYLSKKERQALKQWQEIESKMLIQLERMDELVAVLRDFTGPLPIEFHGDHRNTFSMVMD